MLSPFMPLKQLPPRLLLIMLASLQWLESATYQGIDGSCLSLGLACHPHVLLSRCRFKSIFLYFVLTLPINLCLLSPSLPLSCMFPCKRPQLLSNSCDFQYFIIPFFPPPHNFLHYVYVFSPPLQIASSPLLAFPV